MDVILEFKKTALLLQQDERYLAMQAARKASDEDETLQNLIKEFNLVRLDLNNEIEKEDRDDARVTELNDRINQLYNDIMSNDKMLAFNETKEDIRALVSHIQAIVTAAVDGDDPMTVEPPSESCDASGCASCSGCG